jgi:2-oxoacid:acceptor oxidoreductase delta subunit (pyruvate/2-ketoisovalerate family)
MKEVVQSDGQRKTVAFEGTETVLRVDQVVPAIGQQVNPFGMAELLGGDSFFRPDSWGRLASHPGIFVGGDARGDRGTVSAAVGDGRRAAQAIEAYLRGLELSDRATEGIGYNQINVNYFDHAPRAQAPTVPPGSRNAEAEIELAFTAGQVTAESHRCFSCGECMACDNCWTLCPDNAVLKTREAASDGSHYVFDYDHCKGCGLCAHECPVGFIVMTEEP